jgi:hypothetical protein
MHVPQSMHLPWPKMVKDQGSHRNSWDPRGEPACTPRDPVFFFGGGGMGFSDFCCCQCVLIKLPKFPIGFHNIFPGSQCVPQQHLTLFHNLCPKLYSCNLQAAQKENTNCTKLDFFFFDGPLNDAHHRRKKKKTLGLPTTN